MIAVGIHDEFSRLRTAIVHDGRNAANITRDDWRGLLLPEDFTTHPETGPSSRKRLIQQHARLRTLLTDSGVTVLAPTCQNGAFGQVFTRDPCFVIGRSVFIGALRDPWRYPETRGLRRLRTRFRRVINLSGNWAIIEGGDIMVIDGGRRVLVGMNRHTNEPGVRRLSEALADVATQVVLVPHRGLHLDCCLAPLPDGDALYAPGRLPRSSLSTLRDCFTRMLVMDREESTRHLAANLLWLDRRRVVSGIATPKTNALLRQKGYEVIEMDFSDLVSVWGSFRCVVCPVERQSPRAPPSDRLP